MKRRFQTKVSGMQKRVLMLGGSYFQVPAIEHAKAQGHYVITCDYLPDNPGDQFADEYYNVSTTDMEAVLALARRLNVDGVVAYSSDPAAPTAAYVAHELGLPANPREAVQILTDKALWRDFLRENGFNVVRATGCASLEEARAAFADIGPPVMLKPVDSSGSRGVSKIDDAGGVEKAFAYALEHSRCKRVVVEEYLRAARHAVPGGLQPAAAAFADAAERPGVGRRTVVASRGTAQRDARATRSESSIWHFVQFAFAGQSERNSAAQTADSTISAQHVRQSRMKSYKVQ